MSNNSENFNAVFVKAQIILLVNGLCFSTYFLRWLYSRGHKYLYSSVLQKYLYALHDENMLTTHMTDSAFRLMLQILVYNLSSIKTFTTIRHNR